MTRASCNGKTLTFHAKKWRSHSIPFQQAWDRLSGLIAQHKHRAAKSGGSTPPAIQLTGLNHSTTLALYRLLRPQMAEVAREGCPAMRTSAKELLPKAGFTAAPVVDPQTSERPEEG
jgi:hypothetical protein